MEEGDLVVKVTYKDDKEVVSDTMKFVAWSTMKFASSGVQPVAIVLKNNNRFETVPVKLLKML